jgi:hypothetical protein
MSASLILFDENRFKFPSRFVKFASIAIVQARGHESSPRVDRRAHDKMCVCAFIYMHKLYIKMRETFFCARERAAHRVGFTLISLAIARDQVEQINRRLRE